MLKLFSCVSQWPVPLASVWTVTKVTPASTSRRASKHAGPKRVPAVAVAHRRRLPVQVECPPGRREVSSSNACCCRCVITPMPAESSRRASCVDLLQQRAPTVQRVEGDVVWQRRQPGSPSGTILWL